MANWLGRTTSALLRLGVPKFLAGMAVGLAAAAASLNAGAGPSYRAVVQPIQQRVQQFQTNHPTTYYGIAGAANAGRAALSMYGMTRGTASAVPGTLAGANGLAHDVQAGYRAYYVGKHPDVAPYYPAPQTCYWGCPR